jgi:putative protein-disulfide isomerase
MKLTYFFDPLCSWCFGFSPVIKQLHKSYHELLELEVISGGMITGEESGPVGEVASYIKTAYRDVERVSGIQFGDTFVQDVLKNGTTVFNSLTPSLAMSVIKRDRPEQVFLYAADLNHKIFKEGKAPENLEWYRPLARKYDMVPKYFLDSMHSEEIQRNTIMDFMKTQQFGVNGFPTLLLEKNGEHHVITKGYSRLPDVVRKIEAILK